MVRLYVFPPQRRISLVIRTDCALTVHNTFDPEFRATDNMIDALQYMLEAARLPPPPTPLVSDTLLHDICELITEDDTGAASRTRPSSNGNAKGKGNAKGNTKGNANSSTKGNASASANAKGKAKATTSGPATQAHEPCTETELEDPEDDDMEQLSMSKCIIFIHGSIQFTNADIDFLGTRSFVNLRSASGHILGEIHDRDEYDSTPPPPVPTLRHVVDTFVDKWGFSSAFVSALYDAFCESDTLLDFAYHVNGLSISEIEWLWHFIMVPGSIPLYRSRRLRRRVE